MTRKSSSPIRTFGARALRVALAGVIGAVLVLPAAAQRFEERFPGEQRRRPPAPVQQERPSGFFPFFGGFSNPRPFFAPEPPPPQRPAPVADFSRAPAPAHKGDVQPASTIVVMGDSMADWLAYGLEDILSDTPELGVVRKHKTHSGLVKYDTKADPPDWAAAAKEILNAEKPSAIVMMVGSNDRLALRDAPEKSEKPEKPGDAASTAASEKARGNAGASHEFQSEKWTELYTKRIDDTMNALKARGVPVFWVGLPSQRSTRATADALFLNDLYRARAEKAGIVYVDVWDGFVNEAGKFTVFGPDFEGQNRRLRAGDGVHFTKAGAQKLAHYVDREIKRAMQNRLLPVALPTQEEPSTPTAPTAARPGGPAPRPIAGPVVSLSASPPSGEELLGGNSNRAPAVDPLVSRVLMKGEAPPVSAGRADDYAWPLGSAMVTSSPTVPLPADVTTSTVSTPAPEAEPATAARRPAAEAPAATTPAPGTTPTIVRPQQPRPVTRRAPDEGHPDAVRPLPPRAQPTAPTPPTSPRPAVRRAPAENGDVPRPPAPVGRSAFAPWGQWR